MLHKIYTPNPRGSFQARGDLSFYDFTTPDFITDGKEHELDLSSIVPPGVVAVLLKVPVYDNLPDAFITFKQKGNISDIDIALTGITIRNVVTHLDLICTIGKNRILVYKATNTAWTWIYFFVKGWWFR